MKKKYNLLSLFKSIRLAILLPFSLLIALTLAVILLISINYTEKEVLNNSIDYTTRLIQQIHRDVDSYINYMDNISALVSLNRDVQRFMELDEQDENTSELYSRIATQLRTVLDTRKDIANIGIISTKGSYIFNGGSDQINPYCNYEEQDWYRNVTTRQTTFLSASHVQNIIENQYPWVITFSRSIYNTDTQKISGAFFIDLNYQTIRNLCDRNDLGKDCYVFIMDKKGRIIYHPRQQLLYNGLTTEHIEEILTSEEDSFTINENGQKMLYAVSKHSKNGWMVVGAVNASELTKNKADTKRLYWFSFLGLFGIAILFSMLISSAITRPIQRLSRSMKKVQAGNFSHAVVEVHNEAELGTLAEAFNRMVVQIDQLMKQNIYEQEQKRISEMKALQAQINPHFLYNTLDSIIWMAEDGQTEDVVVMTSSLAKLLRQSISNEHTFVTIREEIEYTRHYLTIQKMRYKDKLNYTIDVSPDILSTTIVRLVVQPIVENAIYHGIKSKDENGQITIRGYSSSQDVCLEIEDDGIGMSAERLEHIFDSAYKHDRHKNGVGIANVQNRLQMQYGSNYGLFYTSTPGKGTLVLIRIPGSEGGTTIEEN